MDSTVYDAPSHDHILDTLGSLIEITRDGQEGFRQAAEHANSPELKAVFLQYSSERAEMVSDLQALERHHGKRDVDDSGTVIGTLHRAWLNLRAAIAKNNDQALLEEAERGEDAALEAYRDALNPNPDALNPSTLPESVTSAISHHMVKVQAAHDDIRDRRDSGRYEVPA